MSTFRVRSALQSHQCHGGDSGDVVRVIDLGSQPGADYFPPRDTPGDDPRWPLELWLCRSCTLVQLGPVEPRLKEPPLAIESATSLAHGESSVGDLVRDHPELSGATVVEFDSHHGGSWLPHLLSAGCRTVADGVRAPLSSMSMVSPMSRRSAARWGNEPNGSLLAGCLLEFHRLLPLLVENQLQTVRHGHWSYLLLGAMSRLAASLGLAVTAVGRVGPDLLQFTVDAAPGKHGRRIPGCGVPIRPVDDLRAARPDVVLVLTWDIADEVISQLESDGGWGAEYLVPLPEPHLVTR